MEARDVIIAPLITEKSMAGTLHQQYSFEVHRQATKTQIRQAIVAIFKVKVVKINTTHVSGNRMQHAR
jgi:large subunit ribosomal protein L23